MARVECETHAVDIENEDGSGDQPGVEVECSRCGHCEASYGESESSVKRCLVLLRENCPEGERNYYVVDD